MLSKEQAFILWLQGVVDTVDASVPDTERWDLIKTRLSDVIGEMVANKLSGEK